MAAFRSVPGASGQASTIQGCFAHRGPQLPGGVTLQKKASGTPGPASGALALPMDFAVPVTNGRPLPQALQCQMERFFNADFSQVRVHVGPEAASIGALAFTIGDAIHFAPGQYQPETARGRQLLGHELTHVVQQRSGRVRNPFGGGLAIVQNPVLEAEADRMGAMAAARAGQAAIPQAPIQARMAPGSRIIQRMNVESEGESEARRILKDPQSWLSDDEDEFIPTQQQIKDEKDIEFNFDPLKMEKEKNWLRKSHYFHQTIGYQFEEDEDASILGGDPGNSKAIDDYDEASKIATSLKTINLMYYYSDDKAESRLRATLKKYLDALKKFDSITKNGKTLGVSLFSDHKIDRLVLKIAIPSGSRDTQMKNVIQDFVQKNLGATNTKNSAVPISIEVTGLRSDWIESTGYLFEGVQNAKIKGSNPGNFPVFDSLEGTNFVSLKAMDLKRNYRNFLGQPDVNSARLKLKEYIDAMNDFNSGTGSGVTVSNGEFTKKTLRVLIPKGTGIEFTDAFTWIENYIANLQPIGIRGIKKKFGFEIVEQD